MNRYACPFGNYKIYYASFNKIKQINRPVRTYRRMLTLVILPSAKFRHIGGYVAYRFRCKNIRPSVGPRIFRGVAVCNKLQGVMPRFLPGDIFSRASGAFITTVDWPRRPVTYARSTPEQNAVSFLKLQTSHFLFCFWV